MLAYNKDNNSNERNPFRPAELKLQWRTPCLGQKLSRNAETVAREWRMMRIQASGAFAMSNPRLLALRSSL